MSADQNFGQMIQTGFRAFRGRRLLEAAVLAAGIALPVALAGIALGMTLRYHPLGGWLPPILAVAGLAAGLAAAWRFGERHRLSHPQFLRHLERRLSLEENELVNAAEMEQRAATMEDALSRGLADLTVARGRAAVQGVSWDRLAPALKLRRPALWGASSLLVGAVLGLLFPSAFLGSISRLARPGSFDLPPALALQITPGNATVDRGSEVQVRALLATRSGSSPTLLRRAAGGPWRSVPMAPDPASAAGRPAFTASLGAVDEPTEYAVALGQTHSDTYRIQVITPLGATGYRKRVEFPSYTGLSPQEELSADGSLSALIGSRATLTVLPSRPRVQGRLLIEGRAPLPLEPQGQDGLAATLAVREPVNYQVELTSTEGSGSRWISPSFRLDAVPDRAPTIFQLAPEREIKLPPEMSVKLDLDCLDDFGLTRLDLVYRRNDGAAQRQTIARWTGTREARVLHPWDLEGIAKVPGDVIFYHLELTDNDAVTGPKTTASPECRIRYPSMDELYSQVEQDRQDQTSDLKQTLETQRELKESLKQIQDELRQNKDMRWEQQEQLKDLSSRQQQVEDKVGELSQSLEKSLDRMQQANLFTPEMVQKVQEINQLAQQIQSPDFKQYMQQLQASMQKLDRNAVNRALENLKMSQEDLERNLDRTLNMLKQLQREELLDQLVNQAERLTEEQKDVNRQLGEKKDANARSDSAASDSAGARKAAADSSGSNKSHPGRPQSSGDEQKKAEQAPNDKMTPEQAAALKQKQEELRRELEKLQQQMDKLKAEAEQKWQALKKQMEQRNPEQHLQSAAKSMEKASQSMSSCHKKKSLQFGRESEQALENFSQGMRQAQKEMENADQADVTKELYDLSGELVQLSKDQGTLRRSAPARSTRDLAEDEQHLAEGARKTLDRLFELGRKSRFITPDLGHVMGEAVHTLDNSMQAFGDGDRGNGMAAGAAGSQALDATVLALLNANQKACNSSCSGSCNNPIARMRSLSGEQEDLNGQTQQMLGQQGGQRLSQSGSNGEKLLQLAAQQEMIAQGLRDVQQSMADPSAVLGHLQDIAKDMDDVAQQMRNHDVDPRVLERQQRILSRLLTATKSLHKEGEKEERVGRPEVNPPDAVSPPPVDASLDWQEVLRRGILRGSQDPVPEDYRKLVDTYFRSLGGQH